MYLTHPLDKIWALDIEGNDLFPGVSIIWCLCGVNIGTGQQIRLRDPDDINDWVQERLEEGSMLAAHNGLGYDFRALNKLALTKVGISRIIDTMLMSMVYSPSIDGGHSLAAWGKRLGHPKGEWDDFSKYSPEMEDYCMNDAILCKKIYVALRTRMNQLKFTDTGLEIEHKSWQLLQKQKDNGFAFNIKEAHILYSKLREKENEIRDRIHVHWPPALTCVFTGKLAHKKDGSESANYTRHKSQYVDVRLRPDGQQYDCYDLVYFSIGSPSQRVEKLLELGWKPLEFTKKTDKGGGGNPQPTVKGQLSPSLAAFVEESGKEEVKLIAQWIEYNARANMINTWMEAYNDDTGCIHGSLWLANTLRYRHSNPNTANIPGVREDKDNNPKLKEEGVYTYEARDLWTVRNTGNRRLVGVDAKGIQLRSLAHYIKNEDFTDSVLSKDPHEANKQKFGFDSRKLTKTITYAVLMGAGVPRVSSEAGISIAEATSARERFFGHLPEIPILIKRLKKELETTGRITLCDGSKVLVPSDHMVIPYLLQGDESKIMKKAMITINNEARREGLDFLQVGMIHDELQFDVHERDVGGFEALCLKAFRDAGEFFQYKIRIDGDVSTGLTWAESH